MIVFSPSFPFPSILNLTATKWSNSTSRPFTSPTRNLFSTSSSLSTWTASGSWLGWRLLSVLQSFTRTVHGGWNGEAMPSLAKLTRLFGGRAKWWALADFAMFSSSCWPARASGYRCRRGGLPWTILLFKKLTFGSIIHIKQKMEWSLFSWEVSISNNFSINSYEQEMRIAYRSYKPRKNDSSQYPNLFNCMLL